MAQNKKKKKSIAHHLVDTLLDSSQERSVAAPLQVEMGDQTVDLEREGRHKAGDRALTLAPPAAPSPEPAATATEIREDEKTYRFGEETKAQTAEVLGRVAAQKQVRGSGVSSLEASLVQSESLRVAQTRILELEGEIDRLRRENEELLAAGETLRRRSDELIHRAERAEAKLKEESFNLKDERRLMHESSVVKDREISRLKGKIEEFEIRLENDLKKIRVRERELENRLELMKMEEAALLRNKDDIILDLKRRIDQLTSETENYRHRSADLHKQLDEDQEKFRRTVRALRLALSMLEESEDFNEELKRAE